MLIEFTENALLDDCGFNPEKSCGLKSYPVPDFQMVQNSPYFCIFWNEAENRERDWGECEACELRARKSLTPRFTDFFIDFEKKLTVLQSKSSISSLCTAAHYLNKYKKLQVMQPRIKNKSQLPVGE